MSDPHQAYRENIQKFDEEAQHVWENLRHGVFVGTAKFVKKIKKRYLSDMPHAEVPSHKRFAKDANIDSLLSKAAGVLKVE